MSPHLNPSDLVRCLRLSGCTGSSAGRRACLYALFKQSDSLILFMNFWKADGGINLLTVEFNKSRPRLRAARKHRNTCLTRFTHYWIYLSFFLYKLYYVDSRRRASLLRVLFPINFKVDLINNPPGFLKVTETFFVFVQVFQQFLVISTWAK